MQLSPNQERHLHVAILSTGEIFGGAERQILTLAETLASEGQASPVFLLFHDGELADRARRLGIPVRVLGAGGLLDLKSILLLRQFLHTECPDVVSVHGYRASVYLALSHVTLPVVKTEHGAIEATTGRLLLRSRPRIYRWLENIATRWMRAHVVYVTYDLQSRCHREHRHIEQCVIYNGITPPDHASTICPLEFREENINVALVGRLEPVKGVDIAIRALVALDTPRPTRLFVIGSGPERDSLADLARELGVAEQVSFLGFRANVYDYIAHADVLLMPSHHEGLPYTLLEALSLGTPVIASRVGGLAEVLVDRHTALLVDPASPIAIAKAILTLNGEPNLVGNLIRNGREMVAARFTAANMTRRYRSLFESVRRVDNRR